MSHYCRFLMGIQIYQRKAPTSNDLDVVWGTLQDVVSSELTVTMPQKRNSAIILNKGMLIALLSVKLESEGFLASYGGCTHLIVTIAIVAKEEHKRTIRGRHRFSSYLQVIKKSPPANISFLETR
ncbi:hypothetical protein AVEN_109746-1 [Araneus ventricosus]|uniref:Uncharacterized protein n=1 Tax=Araneus ventricosus TaxID=182803 RepID=A0A4Y2TAV9_ARAVE|nr:hypothetical protein AVEN_109746-1 [Araneus ventricosus]